MKLSPFFLAFKMFRGNRDFISGFVLIFSLGLSLFLLTDNLAFYFKKDLQNQSREILEGDLKIQSRRDFTEEEKKWIEATLPEGTLSAEVWSFFSMVQTLENTGLVQIKAISSGYPLLGVFEFKNPEGNAPKPSPNDVWIPPEFELKFGAKIGDSIKIGEKQYYIKKEYLSPPQKGLEFFNLGEKLYVSLESLAQTGLLQKGSRIFKDRLYILPEEASLDKIKEQLEKGLVDPEIKITTYATQTGQLSLAATRIFSFLSLATLSAFFLSALGAGHFFYRNLVSQNKQFAQLAMVGYGPLALIKIGLTQNLALAILSSFLSILISFLMGLLLTPLLLNWFDVHIPFVISQRLLIQAIGVSCVTSLVFSISSLKKLWKVHPGILIQPQPYVSMNFRDKIIPAIIQGLYFYGLGFYTTSSFVQSALFLGIVAVGFMFLGLAAFCIYFILHRSRSLLGYGGKLVLGNYKLAWDKTLMTFCILGLAVTLTEIVPAMQKLIIKEIESPKGLVLPQYFMFDIQGEQFPFLEDSLSQWGVNIRDASPMIRARLISKNGEPIRKDLSEASTPEENTRQRFNNRGYNLSYREWPGNSETIIKGSWWQGPFEEKEGELPQISVEHRFATRLKIEIGDKLEFDVQGVPIAGMVTSLRRVRWASFQPNFFLLFQPGVLEIAPKTYIGTLPQLGQKRGYEIEKLLAKNFPNVSVIDVKDVVHKVMGLYQKMGWLVITMAVLGLVIGIIILSLLLNSIIHETKKRILLLMVLGLPANKILKWSFYEFGGLIAGASILGFAVAQFGVLVLNSQFLELPWRFHVEGFVVLLVGVALSLSVCMLYIRSILLKGNLTQFFQSD